jgi:hypothetical protein
MELILLKVKLLFAKLWAFFKMHGIQLLFGITAITSMFLLKNKSDVIQHLLAEQEAIRKAHIENIDGLTKQLETEVSKRQKIERDHTDLLRVIAARHDEELNRIAKVREKEIKELFTKHQNDPRRMTQTINDLFGIPVMDVPPEKQTWEQ